MLGLLVSDAQIKGGKAHALAVDVVRMGALHGADSLGKGYLFSCELLPDKCKHLFLGLKDGIAGL